MKSDKYYSKYLETTKKNSTSNSGTSSTRKSDKYKNLYESNKATGYANNYLSESGTKNSLLKAAEEVANRASSASSSSRIGNTASGSSTSLHDRLAASIPDNTNKFDYTSNRNTRLNALLEKDNITNKNAKTDPAEIFAKKETADTSKTETSTDPMDTDTEYRDQWLKDYEDKKNNTGTGLTNLGNTLKKLTSFGSGSTEGNEQTENYNYVQENAEKYNTYKQKQIAEKLKDKGVTTEMIQKADWTYQQNTAGPAKDSAEVDERTNAANEMRNKLIKNYGLTDDEINEAIYYYENSDDFKNMVAEGYENFADEHPVIASLGTIGAKPYENTLGLLNKANQYATGNVMTETQYPSDTMRAEVGKNLNEATGIDKASTAYDMVMSALDSAYAAYTGAAIGGAYGEGELAANIVKTINSTLMGVEKADQVANDAISRGLAPDKVVALSGLSYATTAVTEGKAMDSILDASANWATGKITNSWAKLLLQSGISEGTQEVAEGTLDVALDTIISGDKSQIMIDYQDAIDQGATKADAIKTVAKNLGYQALTDALGGALGGVMMTGAANAVQTLQGNDNEVVAEELAEDRWYQRYNEAFVQATIDLYESGQEITNETFAEELQKNLEKNGIEISEDYDLTQSNDVSKRVNDLKEMKSIQEEAEKSEKQAVEQAETEKNEGIDAKISGTDEDVKVYGFSKNVQDGSVLSTNKGDIKKSDIKLNTGIRSSLIQIGESLEDSTAAQNLIDNYKGENVNTYARMSMLAYNTGRQGLSLDSFLNSKDAVTKLGLSVMREYDPSDAYLTLMYNNGKNNAGTVGENSKLSNKATTFGEVRNAVDSTLKPIYEAFAKNTKLNINIDNIDTSSNGTFSADLATAVVNTAGNNEFATLIHEGMGEFALHYNQEGMKNFQKAVLSYMQSSKGESYLSRQIQAYQDAYRNAGRKAAKSNPNSDIALEAEKTYSESVDEYVNDFISGMLMTDEGIKDFVNHVFSSDQFNEKEKTETIKTFGDWINHLITIIKNAISGKKVQAGAADALRSEEKALEGLRDQLWKVVEDAKANLNAQIKEKGTVNAENETEKGTSGTEIGTAENVGEAIATESAEQARQAAENYLGGEMYSAKDVKTAANIGYSLDANPELMEAAIKANNKTGNVDVFTMNRAQATRKITQQELMKVRQYLPEDVSGNIVVSNGSYSKSVENSLICVRSLVSNYFMDEVSKKVGRPLSIEEQIVCSQILAQVTGDQTECTYCYVKTDRQTYRAMFNNYYDQYMSVIQDVENNKEAYENDPDYGYQKFLDGRKDTKPMRDRYDHFVKEGLSGSRNLSLEDLTTAGVRNEYKNKRNEKAWLVRDAEKYAKGAAWPKSTSRNVKIGGQTRNLEYVAYNGNILKWQQSVIDNLNTGFGLRMYSDSDYVPAFILENMQVVTDAAVRGLKMLSYTKDIGFAKVFAPTGMAINISTTAAWDNKTKKAMKDENGNYICEGMMGAEWDEAKQLREENPNVGIVFVAFDDEMVNWALDQDWIDVVIPYHLVRTGEEVAKWYGYKNYKAQQEDKKSSAWTDGNLKSIPPTVHANNKETYLKALQENNLTPRFGQWIDNPNYMKLVNETRMAYTEMSAVQPNFDLNAAKEEIARIPREGAYGVLKGLNTVEEQQSLLSGYVDEASKSIKKMSKVAHSEDVNAENDTEKSIEASKNSEEKDSQAEFDSKGVKYVSLSSKDMNNNLHEAHNMNALGPVKFHTEFDMTGTTQENSKILYDYIKEQGWEILDGPSIGKIEFSINNIGDLLRHATPNAVASSIDMIPYVINYGKIVFGDISHKGKGYNTVTLVAPVKYTGKGFYKYDVEGTYYSGVTISRKWNQDGINQKAHVTDVATYIKKESPNMVPNNNERRSDADSPSLRAILEYVAKDVNIPNKYFSSQNPDEKLSFSVDVDPFFESFEEIDNYTKKEEEAIYNMIQDGLNMDKFTSEITIHRIAKNIKESYNSSVKLSDLEKDLKGVFNYLNGESKVSMKDVMQVMKDVALPVIQNTKTRDEYQEKIYKDFVSEVRSHEIALSPEQMQEVAYAYGSYSGFKSAMAGMIKLNKNGTKLDDIWTEICDRSGGMLDYGATTNEQPIILAQAINSMKPSVQELNNQTEDEAAQDLALEIFRQYFTEQARPEVAAALKNQMQNRSRALKENYKKKLNEAMKQVEAEKQINLKRLANEIEALTDEEQKAIHDRDLITQAAVMYARQKYIDRYNKLKEQSNDKIAKAKAYYQNSYINKKLRQERTNLKARVLKEVQSLQNMIAHPAEGASKHVPQNLVKATIDMLEAINIDNGGSNKAITERLKKLAEVYQSFKSEEYDTGYDERIAADIQELQKMFENRSYADLNANELDRVLEIVKALKTQIKNANNLILHGKLEDAQALAEGAQEEIRTSRKHKNAATNLLNGYANMHLNAYREFRKLSGYKDGEMMKLFNDLDEGSRNEMQIMKDLNSIFDDVLEGKENQKEIKKFISTNEKDLVDIGIRDKNGNPVKVSRAMRMSIIMHSMNEGNMRHILGAGLSIPNMKLYSQGKFDQAYEDQMNYRYVDYNEFLNAMQAGDTAKLDELTEGAKKKIDALKDDLSDWEKRFLAKAETFFHDETGKIINDTSLKLKGYALARVKNYFPIRSDKHFTKGEWSGLVQDGTLESMGFLKERRFSKNPILLEDITNVIQRQIGNTAKYGGLAIPIRNFEMAVNQNAVDEETGATQNMYEAIDHVWGGNDSKWLQHLLQDLQGGRNEKGGFMMHMRSRFAGATLSLNPSVAIKQAASYPTAAAVVGYKPLMQAMSKMGKGFIKQEGIEELEKINPLLWYRNQGNATQDLADAKNDDLLKKLPLGMQKALNWTQWMDTGTVRTLEYAAKYYVDDNFNLKAGSEDYWNKVSDVFSQIVEQTQPNYSTMQKADIIRNPNSFLKMLVMFKTQPMQNFGILYDAVGELNAKATGYKDGTATKEELRSAQTNAARAITSQAISAATFSAMTILSQLLLHRWYKYRDDDDKFSIEELEAAFGESLASTLSGSFLGGSILYEALKHIFGGETYYGIEVSTIEMIDDLVTNTGKIKTNWEKYFAAQTSADRESSLKSAVSATKSMLTNIGEFTGIPVNNLLNIFQSAYYYTNDVLDALETGSFRPSSDYDLIKSWDPMSQYERIYAAMESGDTEEYDRLFQELVESGKSEEDITSKIVSELKDNYTEGNVSDEESMDYLEDLGYSEGDAYFKIARWDSGKDSDYGRLYEAMDKIAAGESDDIAAVISETQKLVEYGKGKDKVKTQLKKYYAETYKTLYQQNKAADLHAALLKSLMAAGYTEAEAKETLKSWLE